MKILLVLFLSLSLAVSSFAQTVTVGGTSYQTFLGWQAVTQAGQDLNATTDAVGQYPSSTFDNYKDALFAAMLDLGMNNFRVEAKLSDVNATGYSTSGANAAIQPSTATAGQWHYDRMRQMMDAVVEPYRVLMAAQGEVPYVVLCIVDFDDAGYDAENTASEYAFFVDKFIEHFFDTYGYLPNAIEAILEPDTSENTTNWTAAKVANGIVAADALLVSHGYTGIRWIAPSNTNGTTVETWYSDMKTANASVTALLDEISYHRYASPNNTELASLRDAAAVDGNSIAMLEWIGAGVSTLYDDLATGRNTSWQQFAIAFPWSGQSDNGEIYFLVNRTTWAVSLSEKSKYLRHFFKYIRRGAVMKSVTNSNSSFRGVPFVNSNGTYVVPIYCNGGSGTVTVAGLPAGTYGIRYTLGNGTSAPSSYDQALSNQTITAGQDVVFSMAGSGVATVFDINFMLTQLQQYKITGKHRFSGNIKFN